MSISLNLTTGVAAPDYDGLVNLVKAYLNRSDLDARIPAFIELAERRFNRVITSPDREVDEITTVSGDMPLPSDFYQLISAYIDTEPKTPLQWVAPQMLTALYPQQTTGRPVVFTIVSNAIKFAPFPDAPYDLHFTYLRKIELLGANVPGNWLLTAHPDIYLYGALVQAEAFLVNDERISLWKGALDEAMGELIDAGNRRRTSAAPVRLRSSVCV